MVKMTLTDDLIFDEAQTDYPIYLARAEELASKGEDNVGPCQVAWCALKTIGDRTGMDFAEKLAYINGLKIDGSTSE
ncbi:MAG: hypothetical protein ABH849_00830 [Nanoarchaeota archaeon]